MKILRAADYRVMPWKNGLGSTTQIAIFPADAGIDDFDWRISLAQVTSDGAFSSFAGVDRTLLVLSGGGIDLHSAGQDHVRLTRDAMPHAFAGDVPTSAELLEGPISDLNIMTRRSHVRSSVQRITLVTPRSLTLTRETLLFVEHGGLTIRADDCMEDLGPHDTVWLAPNSTDVSLEPRVETRIAAIEFWRVNGGHHKN